MTGPWLLLDVGFPVAAYEELERAGVPVVHAGIEGLAGEGPQQLLEYAIADGCVIVTRNYADFSRLSEAYAGAGRTFPGVLFVPPGLDPSDTVAHARAVEDWYRKEADDSAFAAGRSAWLRTEP
jgi:hypothetical protein